MSYLTNSILFCVATTTTKISSIETSTFIDLTVDDTIELDASQSVILQKSNVETIRGTTDHFDIYLDESKLL